MRSWQRRRGPPEGDPVADGSVTLSKGERLLAYARTADGGWAAGTDRALHLGNGRVLGWHQVDQARWVEADQVLEVVTLPEGAAPPRVHRIEIPAPGPLPELVRERVTSNIVVAERVDLIGTAGARLLARRVPGDTAVRWSAVYDAGVVSGDPAVQERVRAAVAALQSRLGV